MSGVFVGGCAATASFAVKSGDRLFGRSSQSCDGGNWD